MDVWHLWQNMLNLGEFKLHNMSNRADVGHLWYKYSGSKKNLHIKIARQNSTGKSVYSFHSCSHHLAGGLESSYMKRPPTPLKTGRKPTVTSMLMGLSFWEDLLLAVWLASCSSHFHLFLELNNSAMFLGATMGQHELTMGEKTCALGQLEQVVSVICVAREIGVTQSSLWSQESCCQIPSQYHSQEENSFCFSAAADMEGSFITSWFRTLSVLGEFVFSANSYHPSACLWYLEELSSSFLEVINCPACDSNFPSHTNHRGSLFQMSQGMSFLFHCNLMPSPWWHPEELFNSKNRWK